MNDVRYAFRMLIKSPAFSAVAVIILALGIGANTAIFTVVRSVLLAPLPYPGADRIVAVQSQNLHEGLKGQALAPAGFREIANELKSFESVAASRYNYDNFTRVEKPTTLSVSLITEDYFRVLGVQPLIGRTFLPDDAAANAKPSIVLGYNLWQNQFGGRGDIIGQTITVNDVAHEVIGVMPAGFKDPFNIATAWRIFSRADSENSIANARFWGVIGRLKPGVSRAQLQSELDAVSARLAQDDPKFYRNWNLTARPVRDLVVGSYREGLVLVIGAALVVLVITCANVAGLQLVRASTRHREVAIRLAVGASRFAIVRGQLIESLLLVAFGGAGGVLLASWGLDLLLASFSHDWIPRSDEIALNLPVLVATGATAVLTGFLFGSYPAWHAARIDAADAVREGAKTSTGVQSLRLRSVLVVSQIALTLVLLVCAGLVWKSFAAIARVNPGIELDHPLSMVITPAPTRYDTGQKSADYYRELIERVRAVPGVEAVAFTQTMPFTWGIPATFTVDGASEDQAKLPPAFYDSVSPSFFSTMHSPLLSGRTFAETDDANALPVAILSESAARKFFPDVNPIGQRLMLPPNPRQPASKTLTVIGVVGDVPRNGLDSETPYQVYASMDQRGTPFATLLVRSPLPIARLTHEVEGAIWAFNPEQTIAEVSPVRKLVTQTLTQPQLYLALFSLFALLGLLLGGVGLYALVAYTVNQRSREFGIRFALGAQIRDVTRLVLRQSARLTAFGLTIGLVCAIPVARLMTALLFHTPAYDPVVFIGVILLLAAIGLFAAVLPAWRAATVDPVSALRAE